MTNGNPKNDFERILKIVKRLDLTDSEEEIAEQLHSALYEHPLYYLQDLMIEQLGYDYEEAFHTLEALKDNKFINQLNDIIYKARFPTEPDPKFLQEFRQFIFEKAWDNNEFLCDEFYSTPETMLSYMQGFEEETMRYLINGGVGEIPVYIID
ncbi:hypothetical protein A9308_07440 [Moraxella atlantae]|uniref:Uncharacterized protein n=1 Tax=Faucicola atlantae TaxID=34059 RepID=A0A1B8QB88_9GAMM|nr:hypothetical protein [Moraxella atlantae]OBX76759.1 hypothetical protein A9308_07440 [Moraxella atlantae]